MSTPAQFLRDWTERLVRHRDLFTKTLVSLEPQGEDLIGKTKSDTTTYIIDPLGERLADVLSKADSTSRFTFICFNTVEALDALLACWKTAAACPHLLMYFVNPTVSGEMKWVLRPHAHERISDPESLELGLRTLADGVPKMTKTDVDKVAQ
ncbi:MAG: hypothetical protein ABIC95_06910 [archaeon]